MQQQSIALVVVLVAFPLSFVGLWSFVSILLATLSGYRSIAASFPVDDFAAEEGEPLPTPMVVMIGLSSYRGWLVTFRASREGLGIRMSKIFPFHPPMRVPWSRIVVRSSGSSSFVFRLVPAAVELDGRVTLRMTADAAETIAAAQARYGRG